MYCSKSLACNHSFAAKEQFKEVETARKMYTLNEQNFVKMGLAPAVNVGLVPQDVYKDFDRTAVQVMTDDQGDPYLNDIMPLSKSLSIGKLTTRYHQVSDAGRVQTSIGGQVGVKMDRTEYKNDGAIIPITDSGFYRQWREREGQMSEAFDALIDDNREVVKTVRESIADQFLDGHFDVKGNPIVIDGLQWDGMRNDTRVNQVSLVFDFTDDSQTCAAIKAAYIDEIRNVLWITNNCGKDVTYYVSKTIASIWEQRFENTDGTRKTIEELEALMGVASIKVSGKLVGNQIMGFPLDSSVIQPVVGMGINTVALPRPIYNSDHQFAVLGAIGFLLKNDFYGNSCAIYAS